jgi:peroxiredoxin
MDRHTSLSGDKLKSIILVGVIAVVVGIYILHQGQKRANNPGGQPLVVVGRAAPDFALPGLDGQVVRLSDNRGKVVFLNIWATWCGPCREEMPSMEKLYQEMKAEDFEILAVCIDDLGATAVKPFMAELRLTFPVLLDSQGAIKNLYNTTGVPETFIIDKNGIVAAKIIGARDWASPGAVRALKDLLQKPDGEIRSSHGAESRKSN